jgi:hypothetical protein
MLESVLPEDPRKTGFLPVTLPDTHHRWLVTKREYVRFNRKRKSTKGTAMYTKIHTAGNDRRVQAPERNDRRPKLALRQRANDHPMALFVVLAAAAFVGMAFAPTVGPAFASFNPPVNIVDGAPTTTKTARLPMPEIDFVCRGQAWGAESADCLRVIAEQSGIHKARAVRVIANAAPATGTPNVF